MNKILLLACFFLAAGISICFGQSDVNLNRATNFAVLASTQINNNGATSVTGDLGIHPGTTLTGGATLTVQGKQELGTASAANAQQDARAAYNALSVRAGQAINPNLGSGVQIVTPGVYKISGNANLSNIFFLDGGGDVNSTFIFIIDGDFTSASNSGVLTLNGAQARNVFWVVRGNVRLGESTVLQGSLLTQGNIVLESGVSVIGRAISLDGAINLTSNNIFLPNVILANLNIAKEAEAGEYLVGGQVAFNVTVRNAGPGTATEVNVQESIPAGLEFVSAVPSKGAYNQTTHVWSVGNLTNTESATIRLVFRIVAPGTIVNTVTTEAENPDPDTSDNTDDATIEATCPPLNPTLSGGAEQCANATNVTYTVTEVFGATYAYTVPADWTIVSQNANSVVVNIGESTGEVTATVTNLCGQSATARLNVTVTPTPGTPTITGADVVCVNSTDNTYTAEGVTGTVTYEWTVTGGLAIVSGQGTASVVVSSTSAAGGTLSVRAVNTACSLTGETTSKTITAVTTPAVPGSITGNLDVCEGEEVDYSVEAVASATTYTWTIPTTAGWEVISGAGTREIRVRIGSTSGNVSVTANNNCGASTATSTAVTVTNRPAAPTIAGTPTGCVGSELTFSVAEVAGATGYTWTIPATWSPIGSLTSNTIRVTVGTEGGNITAAVTNRCGTGAVTTQAVTPIIPPAKPATPTITGADIVCINSANNTYTVSGVAGEVSYEWVVTGDLAIASGQGSATVSVTSTGVAGGTLSVRAVTTTCAVEGDFATKTITAVTTPAVPGAIAGNLDVCEGEEVVYSVEAVANATTYTWTIPTGNGWEVISGAGTREIRVRIGATSGSISVTAGNSCGTSAPSSAAITVTNRPAAPTIAGTPTGCVGSELTFSVAEVAGATGYTWTIPATWTAVTALNERTIRVTVGEEGGNITATVSNRCGAGTPASIQVTPIALPATPATPTITGADVVCVNSTNNTYTAAGVTGTVTYEWTVTGGLTIVSGQGTASVVVSSTSAAGGTLSVRAITTTCEVSSAVASKTITTTTAPTAPVAVLGNTNVCEGEEVVYSVAAVTGATTYTWTIPTGNGWQVMSGADTREIRVRIGSTSGNVSVTANNNCGASTATSTAVTVTNRPAAPTIAGTPTGCVGSKLTFSVAEVAGATGYTWTIPATWTAVTPLNERTIRVTVGAEGGNITATVSNRCGAGTPASIQVAPTLAPATPAAITVPAQICANSEGNVFSVAAVTGATTYNWTVPAGWVITSGTGTNSITVRANGTGGAVSVTATGVCGISQASSANVTVTTPPAVTGNITDNSTVCNGLTYSIAAVPGATTYNWTVAPGFTIVAGQGTTSITVTSNNPTATGEVTVVASNGNCVSPVAATATIDASLADGQLAFPKAFSPNGDGKNDTWVVGNLSKFPDNEITIFNSWGSEVYKKRNYQNDWNGARLGQGTYYYKARVKLCDGVTKEYTGYVTILR